MIDFLLNNASAWAKGIRMGKGFLESLETPADQKEYITNSIRTEHGDRYIPVRSKLAARSVTLEFVIMGATHDEYIKRFDAFLELLHNGFLTISVPYSRSDVYRLYAQMKSTTYGRGLGNKGVIGKLSVKFVEANPNDRGAFDDDDTLLLSMPEYEDYKC